MNAIPASVLVTSGRFRDNRRGNITVEPLAGDLVAIKITQAADPFHGIAESTTEICLADAHLEALFKRLGYVVRQSRRAARLAVVEATA